MSQAASESVTPVEPSASDAHRAAVNELLSAPSTPLDPRASNTPPAADSERALWIASGAHPAVQEILASFPSGNALGEAAIKVIKLQLALREMQLDEDYALTLDEEGVDREGFDVMPAGAEKLDRSSLFFQAAREFVVGFGRKPHWDRFFLDQLLAKRAGGLIRRAIPYFTRLPFPVVLELRPPSSTDAMDIDEW